MKSNNYDRYKKWYQRGIITETKLAELVEAGLLTEEEKESIINGDEEIH